MIKPTIANTFLSDLSPIIEKITPNKIETTPTSPSIGTKLVSAIRIKETSPKTNPMIANLLLSEPLAILRKALWVL